MDCVKELSEEVSSKCIGEFDGPGESSKLKIYFRVVDALWISEGEAIVKGIEEGCPTSFAEKGGSLTIRVPGRCSAATPRWLKHGSFI